LSERIAVAPSELDLVSPGRRDYLVSFANDTLWAEWRVPLTVLVGPEARDGEGLVAFGSTHGNEYEGPVAIKNLLGELDLARVRGRIVLVPVLNPAAFAAGTRDGAGVNLNRAFVDGAGTSPALASITYRLARFVREQIWPHTNVVLDLHSGGEVMRFALVSSLHYSASREQTTVAIETARWFGTPFIMVYQNDYPGLLTSEAENLGKVTVGTELGWGAAVLEEGVSFARQGILGAAVMHGQLEGPLEPQGHHLDGSQRLVDCSPYECAIFSPAAGWYEPLVPCGAFVRTGDAIGNLHDFERIDSAPWPARAAVDGYVIAQAWTARVVAGQQLVSLGVELDH
jgi:predicted deacylase